MCRTFLMSAALIVLLTGVTIDHAARAQAAPPTFHQWAPTPPLGWNSWDIYGTTITEAQAKAQADAMAKHLLPAGYNVFTVDIQWYEPDSSGHRYRAGAPLAMDAYSRLIPAEKKFPSAAGGAGFKPLADYVHAKGLKFGMHLMRGIPRQAVEQNTSILGADARAADIANTASTCEWNPDMYGVDMRKPGAQAYYDSLFEMYASWGVDYVKVDDISRPYDATQQAEIEVIRKAIDKTNRPIVLSLSPGATPLERGQHVAQHANLWRIADDFWDRWPLLYEMFTLLDRWTPYRQRGAWPDADMLPLGVIKFDQPTNFTLDEQRTCMTLWCVARSPLIFGGDMTKLDRYTLDLLTNPEVLAVNQASSNNRQLARNCSRVIWVADAPDSPDKYVALFNVQNTDLPYDLEQAIYRSPVIRGDPGQNVTPIAAPLNGATSLLLVVTDGGDTFEFDHSVWIEPTLIGPAGALKLTDLKWESATSGWGQVHVNRTVEDLSLTLNGSPITGIGTHSNSVIKFNIPAGYDKFTARVALLPQSNGNGSVEFIVLAGQAQTEPKTKLPVSVSFKDLGIRGEARVRDLWQRKNLGVHKDRFTAELPMHGAGLYRISPRGAEN